MPPEDENKTETESQGTQPEGQQPPPSNPNPPAPQPAQGSAKKVVTVPTDAFTRIKNEEREKGRKSAEEALDAKARELGFANHAELLAFARDRKSGGGPTPSEGANNGQRNPQPKNGNRQQGKTPVSAKRYETDRKGWEGERARLNRLVAHSDKKYRSVRKQFDALQAEQQLREVAIREGVQDVDYALQLLRKEYAGKSVDELKAFDERAYFKDLRAKKPVLFQIEEREATTGTENTPTPKVDAKPPPVNPAAGGKKTKEEIAKMPKKEYDAYLKEQGIRNPATSNSY